MAGMTDCWAVGLSVALQYGVPLASLCDKFEHVRFEPSGFTRDENVPIASSIVDYIARWLKAKFLSAAPAAEGGPVPVAVPLDEVMARVASPQGRNSNFAVVLGD